MAAGPLRAEFEIRPEAAGSRIKAICLPSGDQTGDWSVSTLGSRKRSDFSCTSYTPMKA